MNATQVEHGVTQSRLFGLQVLRALAALLVVVDHAILSLIDKAGLWPHLTPWAGALGDLGVTIFFAISGFIMAYTTNNSFGAGQSWSFLLRRIFRIVPLYWLVTTIYIARLWFGGTEFSSQDVLNSYLFIPFMDGEGFFRPLYGLGWTLNYEMMFYFVFALALNFSRTRGLFFLSSALVGLVLIGMIARPDPAIFPILSFYTNSIVLAFVLGVFGFHLTKRLPNLSMTLAAPLLLFGGAAAIYMAVMADAIAASSAMLIVSFLSVVVAALVQTPRSKGWLLALGVALGDASFSIYLTHSFLLGPTSWVWGGRLGMPNELAFLYVGAAVIGSSLLGWATYRIVEQPFMKAVRPLLKAGRRESMRAA